MTCAYLNQSIERYQAIVLQFENLFERFDLQIEEQAHIARYLCVLGCGLLEEGIKGILTDFCTRKTGGAPEVMSFCESRLRRFQTPKIRNISDLLKSFSLSWAEAFDNAIEDRVRDHVNAVVAQRHLIAHGRHCSISFGTMITYSKSIRSLLNSVEEIVGI